MFPTPLHPLTEVYSCTRGLFGRKCGLNDCTDSYISEIKWFWEHFEVIAYFVIGYYCFVALTVTDGCKTGWIVKCRAGPLPRDSTVPCWRPQWYLIHPIPPPPPHVIYNVHTQCLGAAWLDKRWTRFVARGPYPWAVYRAESCEFV